MRKTSLVGIGLVVLLSAPLSLWLHAVLAPTGLLPGTSPSVTPLATAMTQPATAAMPVTSTLTATVYLPLAENMSYPADTQPFGIAMYEAIDANSGVAQMQAAGSTRLTTILRWSTIEPTNGGGYDWSAYDTKIAYAAAHGMSVHVLFDNSPSWVSANPRGPVPAAFMPNLENVISATVQHYNGANGLPRIDHWSLYGEPDNVNAWGKYGADYAEMLVRIAPIIHSANPSAKVVLGGLAYDFFTDDEIHPGPGGLLWVRNFLPDTLRQLTTHGSAANYIDMVAFNFYPISLPRWPTIKEKAQTIRSVMAQYGVGQLPLIVLEMSMWSMWPNNQETQPQQAHWLVEFYVRGLSVGIQQLYWFQVFDVLPVGPGSAQGLFRGQNLNDPKQSYHAYDILTQQLRGLHFTQSLNLPNAEGYVFAVGTVQKTVIWGTQQSSPTLANFSQTCIRRVDMLGAASQITDGGPGDLDGLHNGAIRLSLNFDEPIYVETC